MSKNFKNIIKRIIALYFVYVAIKGSLSAVILLKGIDKSNNKYFSYGSVFGAIAAVIISIIIIVSIEKSIHKSENNKDKNNHEESNNSNNKSQDKDAKKKKSKKDWDYWRNE